MWHAWPDIKFSFQSLDTSPWDDGIIWSKGRLGVIEVHGGKTGTGELEFRHHIDATAAHRSSLGTFDISLHHRILLHRTSIH